LPEKATERAKNDITLISLQILSEFSVPGMPLPCDLDFPALPSRSVSDLGSVTVIPRECGLKCSNSIPASSDRRRPPANPIRIKARSRDAVKGPPSTLSTILRISRRVTAALPSCFIPVVFCGCRRTGQCPERPLNFGEQRLFDAADRALFNAKRQGRNRLACAEIVHAAIVIAESGPRIGLDSPNHPGGKVPSDGG